LISACLSDRVENFVFRGPKSWNSFVSRISKKSRKGGRPVADFSNSPAARVVDSYPATTRVRHVGLLHREYCCGWCCLRVPISGRPDLRSFGPFGSCEHTTRMSRRDGTECLLYRHEGTRRGEGRAVRPTWRTLEKSSRINTLSFRRWGNCWGISCFPRCIPPSGNGQGYKGHVIDPLNILSHGGAGQNISANRGLSQTTQEGSLARGSLEISE
jgi:hypothetical protein